MRAVLALGAVLVLTIASDLFMFHAHTDRWFAWHVESPVTAPFLGSFYATACLLAVASYRRRRWAEARVGIPGVFVFVCLTLWVTVVHLDRLQFRSPGLAPLVSYAWVVVYAVDPLLILGAWLLQRTAAGSEPPRRAPVPGWYRWALVALACEMLSGGILLVGWPTVALSAWPWPASALDLGAIGAWVVGLAIVVGQAAWESSWERIEVAVTSATLLGVLHLLVLWQFRATLADNISSRALIATALSVLLIGAYGVVAARRAAHTAVPVGGAAADAG